MDGEYFTQHQASIYETAVWGLGCSLASARSGRVPRRLIVQHSCDANYINLISGNKGWGIADLEALWRRNERSLCLSEFQGNELCDEKNNVRFLTLVLSQKIIDLQSSSGTSGYKVTPDEYLMGENHD
jgi:hypothetical protein